MCRLLAGNAKIPCEAIIADSIYDAEIHSLRRAALRARDLFKRHAEHLGRRSAMNVVPFTERADHALITAHVRKQAKLDLGIVRIHEQMPLACDKRLADLASELRPHRDVLQIRLRARNAPRRCHILIKTCVDPPALRPHNGKEAIEERAAKL